MHRKHYLTLTALGLLALSFLTVRAQEALTPDQQRLAYIKATQSIEKDLTTALEELAAQRAAIAEEKPALAKEANTVAADLREKRRQADLARSTREGAEARFTKLDSDLKMWRDERQYIESLLFEFRKNFETEQSLARNELNRPLLEDNSLSARLALLGATLDQLADVGHPSVVEGQAVGAEGVLTPGNFVEAGPVSWFVSHDRAVSGLVVPGADLLPQVIPGTQAAAAIERLTQGESASLSFDPTLGTAVALGETKVGLIAHIRSGGFWVYPILLLGIISFFAFLVKWFQLGRIKDFPLERVSSISEQAKRGNVINAMEMVNKLRHPSRQILEQGVRMLNDKETYTKEEIEEGLYEKYVGAVPPLQRGLPLLAIAAGAAPLLGLLATVTGIMKTFRLINVFGTGDAKSLASGISEALVGTECGLIVAIPSLIIHALLSRRVHAIKDNMEMTSLAFINSLEPEAEQKTPRQPVASPTPSVDETGLSGAPA